MSFRKENKYKVTLSDMLNLNSILHERGMKKLYPKRQINSCYFDDDQFTLFNQSEEGVLPRKKIRVRWYNGNKSISKEIKISSFEGRYKESNIIGKFKNVEEIYKLEHLDNNYGLLKPKLIVSYVRDYYEFKNVRITFDRNIKYKLLTSFSMKFIEDEECVIEIKAPAGFENDYIEGILAIPTSRFSKYSRGILSFRSF